MSQIFGAINPLDPAGAAALLANMGRLQRRSSQAPATTWTDASGRGGLGGLFSREHGCMGTLPTVAGPPGAWLLDGEIYRLSPSAEAAWREHRGDLLDPHGAEPGRPPLAYAIPLLYARFGSDFVSHLDGSFCVALHDPRQRTLILANDRFATRAMYWSHYGGAFLFASELKGLLAASFLPRTIDIRALSEFFAFNRVLGDRTLLEHVRRLAPATRLEYDSASGALEQHVYWTPVDDVARRLPLSPQRLDAMTAAFRRSVILRSPPESRVGISLSGGLDSRVIAAIMAGERRPVHTCTTGIVGCADQRLARRVARAASASHSFYALTREMVQRYVDALHTAIRLTDGMVLVGGFPAGLTQVFCDEHRIDILLRGHGGENARLQDAWPFQVNDAVLTMRSRSELLGHLRRVLWTTPPQVDWPRLFPDAHLRPAEALADASLSELLGQFPADLTPAETMNLLYLSQVDATGPPATRSGLRAHTEMGLPYLDYPFISLILATDARERCGPTIQHGIIRRTAPSLMRIPNSNTGAPLDASSLRLTVTDKLNTLMRRLQLPGFRHYHYMELWIKDLLAAQVDALVLDKRTLSRGLYDPRYLTRLVGDSRSDTSMSRLLNLVVNLEIWFRLFCDGEALTENTA